MTIAAMYGIDILSSYIVCGAACMASAGMLALMRSDSLRTVLALRLFGGAFLASGVGLLSFLLAYDLPLSWLSNGCASLVILAMGLSGWGLRELNGDRTRPRTGLALVGGSFAAMLLGWALLSEQLFGVAFCLLGMAIATLIAVSQRRFILAARRPVDLALAAAIVGFALLWLMRTYYTVAYEGPALLHHLYVPEQHMSWFALAYAVMPVLLASLLMVTVNHRLNQQLERRAHTDELTGLTSRTGLRDLGPLVLTRAAERLQDVAVMMLDIDHFQAVNEQHGALAGDDVLRHLARLLRQVLRADALLTRYGGEEFALLVPLDHAAMAAHVAERLRLSVERHPCHSAGVVLPLRISIGLTLHRTAESLDSALRRADRLLYQAKASGRNCICDDLHGPVDLDEPIDLDRATETTVCLPAPGSEPPRSAGALPLSMPAA